MSDCSVSHDVVLVVMTTVSLLVVAAAAFTLWAFREGEEGRKRRDAEARAKYDTAVH